MRSLKSTWPWTTRGRRRPSMHPRRTCGPRSSTRSPRRARHRPSRSSSSARRRRASRSSRLHSCTSPLRRTTATTHCAPISHWGMTGRMCAMTRTKVRLSLRAWCVRRACFARYVGAVVGVHGAVRGEGLYCLATPFLAPADGAAAHPRHDRARLDPSVDVHGGAADVAQVGRAVGQGGRRARGRDCGRGEPRTSYVFLSLCRAQTPNVWLQYRHISNTTRSRLLTRYPQRPT